MWKCSRFLICEILDFFSATGNRPIVKVLVNYSNSWISKDFLAGEKAINSSAQNRGETVVYVDINTYTIIRAPRGKSG
jgi:hypothetical protein